MASLGRIIWRAIWSVGLAVAVAATPIPLNALAFLTWAALTANSRSVGAQVWVKAVSRAIPIVVMGVVLLLAIQAPKTVDRIMDRRVVLPKTKVRLGELREWTEGPRPLGLHLPVGVSMVQLDTDASRVVEFPALELSLRQFVASIENQTPLRHHFRSCGNGYSIRDGQDCSFGMTLGY
jgi:hypothetical protein